jgi:hypothetical protein
MTRLALLLICAIFGHDAEGPDTENEFLCGSCSTWKPFYLCRRCKVPLMWNCQYPNGWLTTRDGNFSGMQGPISGGSWR